MSAKTNRATLRCPSAMCKPTEAAKNDDLSSEGGMENALKATGFGKFNVWIILSSGLMLYAATSECWSIGYVIPSAECDMQLTLREKTLLVTVGPAGILTTQFFWGFLSDRRGRRNVMLCTLAAGCCCTTLSALAPMYWLVALLRYLNGTFVACAAGLCFAYVGEFFCAQDRAVAIMAMSVANGIALTLIPLTAWAIIPAEVAVPLLGVQLTSWRIFLLISGLPALAACGALFFSPESPKFLAQANRTEDALDVLKQMHRINQKSSSKRAYPIEKLGGWAEGDAGGVKLWELFGSKHLWRTLLVGTIQGGTFATSGGLYLWYPDILQRLSHSTQDTTVCGALNSPQDAVAVAAVSAGAPAHNLTDSSNLCNAHMNSSVYTQNIFIGVAYTVGYVAIGALVRKVGIKYILASFLGTAGLATLALHWITNPHLVDSLFLAMLVLSGLCSVVVNAAVVEIYPTNLRGMAVCFTLLCGRLGTIVASSLVGYLLLWNCDATFMLFAAGLIACSLLALLVPSAT